MIRRLTIALPLLAIAACGTAQQTAVPTQPAAVPSQSAAVPSRAAWIVAADRICQNTRDRIGAIAEAQTLPAIADWATRAADASDVQLADLRSLPVSAGDEGEVAALLSDAEALVVDLRALAEAATAGDPAGVRAVIERRDAARAGVEARAATFGLRVCGTSPSPSAATPPPPA